MSLVGGPGTFSAMENENVIMGVDGYAGNLAEDHAVGKNRPAVYDGVRFGGISLGDCSGGGKNRQDGENRKGSGRTRHGRPRRLRLYAGRGWKSRGDSVVGSRL